MSNVTLAYLEGAFTMLAVQTIAFIGLVLMLGCCKLDVQPLHAATPGLTVVSEDPCCGPCCVHAFDAGIATDFPDDCWRTDE